MMNAAVTLQPTEYSTFLFSLLFSTPLLLMFVSTIMLPPPTFVHAHSFKLPFPLLFVVVFQLHSLAFILLRTLKLWKCAQLLTTNANCFRWLPCFFSSLNILLVTFIFSSAYHLLINTWSLKLIWPITTSLCVPCTTTWKHLASSLWMNVANFIFRLLHIHNCPTLSVLIPLHLPCTPFVDYAHSFLDCENTFSDCINFSTDCAHNFDDCANTPNDRMNTTTDLADRLDISFVNFCIPNLALLQLLFFYRSKIKTVFTIGSMNISLFSSFFIYGFYIWHPSSSSFVSEFAS
jgi:hypothetical protein